MIGAITSFRGEYAFLSNYFAAPFVWRNIEFQSGEQAFAYAKTLFCANPVEKDGYQRDILSANSPGDAKKLGRICRIDIAEWDRHKVSYMRDIVHAKFLTGTGLIGPLINTGAAMLIEGNDWGDKFWGRVKENGKWDGHNVLGVILMEERGWWNRSDESRP